MKVVCDSCQAKYQVPDERVAGRKLRIRCRRCSAAIIVRGDQLQSEAPPAAPGSAPAVAAPDSAEWYASHEEQEQGPMALSELMGWLGSDGQRWSAYVWHEGMSDWQEAREVTGLQRALGSAPPPAGDEQPTQMVDAGGGFDDVEPTSLRASDTLDPFAVRASHPPLASARPSHPPLASDEPSYPMHTPAVPEPRQAAPRSAASDPSVPPPVSSPYVSAADAMTGSRNEESVLFNAASLRQVAASSSPSIAPGAHSSPPQSAPGYAGGDASGLIDIRALSDLSKQAAQRSAPPAPPSRDDHVIHTPLVGTVPALTREPKASGSSAVLPVSILAGSLVLAAAVFLGLSMRPAPAAPPVAAASALSEQVPVVEAPVTPAPVQVAAATETEAEAEAEAEAPAVDGEAKAEADGEAAAVDADAASATKLAKSTTAKVKASKPRPRRKSTARRKAAAPKAVASKSAPGKSGGDDLDDLLKADAKPEAQPEPKRAEASLDDALLGGPSPKAEKADKPEAKPEPAGDRSIDDLLSGAAVAKPTTKAKPASPTKPQVIKAMNGVKAAVKRCGQQHSATGVVKAQVTVVSSGKVKSVAVSGVSGPAGGCIESAVKRAKFPAFSKPSFSVKYPFKL